jgi:hypothetical protein
VAARPSVRVPSSAVISEGDTRYVWRVQGEQIERVAVRIGGERNGQTEIQSGINAGETVVSAPVEGLQDGMKVKTKSS